MQRTIAAAYAAALSAHATCVKTGNAEWEATWSHRMDQLDRLLPSGSGLDFTPRLDRDASSVRHPRQQRLVFERCHYHHMNEFGMYDGWTEHTVTAAPSFGGLSVLVTGPDRNGVKEYIGESFEHVLRAPAPDWSP